MVSIIALLFSCLPAIHARAQQREPEDPGDDKRLGLRAYNAGMPVELRGSQLSPQLDFG